MLVSQCSPRSLQNAILSILLCLPIVSHCSVNPYVFPGEAVPTDTLRIIALGTGVPNIFKSQAATSYLLQLGSNERSILFDVGTGSIANLYATRVKLSTIDKVFISHAHSDHITDLAPLYALANGRPGPLQVWGPSGASAATGIAAIVEGLRQFLAWDQEARNKVMAREKGKVQNAIVAHQFDHNVSNQVIYEQDGIRITSTPVFHYATPGPVALRLDWNNISFTFSGDTIPLQSFLDLGSGSDVVLHETVGPVNSFHMQDPTSRNILLNHTSQSEVGAIFQKLQPRLAIATHLSVNEYSIVPILSSIRSTYPTGPLAIAQDFAVWDVSRRAVSQRKFVPVTASSGYEFADPCPAQLDLEVNDNGDWPRAAVACCAAAMTGA